MSANSTTYQCIELFQLDVSPGVKQMLCFLAQKTEHSSGRPGLQDRAQMTLSGPDFSPFLLSSIFRLSPQGVRLAAVILAPPSCRLKYQWEEGIYLAPTNP